MWFATYTQLRHKALPTTHLHLPPHLRTSIRLLISMAVEKCRRIKQGDCKSAFCNARLPDNKTTIIKPPSCDPDSKKDVF